MRIFILFLCILLWSSTLAPKAQENIYSEELLQLRNLNTEFTTQLSSATQEIKQNDKLKFFDKIQKELGNKSYEIKMLRRKIKPENEKFY